MKERSIKDYNSQCNKSFTFYYMGAFDKYQPKEVHRMGNLVGDF